LYCMLHCGNREERELTTGPGGAFGPPAKWNTMQLPPAGAPVFRHAI
jgi:hypothetical protein